MRTIQTLWKRASFCTARHDGISGSYENELATLGSTVLQVRQLYDNVDVNKANVESKHIALQRASYDYDNRKRLVNSLAVSNEDFVHAKDDFLPQSLTWNRPKHS